MNFINMVEIIFLLIVVFMAYGFIRHRELISFASKNLYRNLRRTSLTLIAIILATTAMIFVETYVNNTFWGLRESTIRSQLGHIQIQLKDFLEKGRAQPTEYLIEDYEDILSIIKNNSEVTELIDSVTTEIRFSGIIRGNGNNSVNFIGRGVDAESDHKFSSLDILDEGSSLSKKNIYGITMGSGLAKILGVQVNDYVTLLAPTADGGTDILDADVRGIFSPLSRDYSSVIVKSDIDYARQLIGTEGVNKIVILLKDTKATDFVAAHLREKIEEKYGNRFKVYQWRDLAEFYTSVENLYNNFFTVFKLVISLIVFFLIMNTMTMSIFERFQEIGTLRSIGFTRSKIVYLMLDEGFILGVVGAIIGEVLGLLLCEWINNMEIMLAPPPGQSRGVPLILQFRENYEMLVNAFSLAVSIAWVSSLFPAIKAAKLKIVDCLRHV